MGYREIKDSAVNGIFSIDLDICATIFDSADNEEQLKHIKYLLQDFDADDLAGVCKVCGRAVWVDQLCDGVCGYCDDKSRAENLQALKDRMAELEAEIEAIESEKTDD